jgi:hypothetical protein
MAWKLEKWMTDVFPGESNIYSAYRELPFRELAIVSGAVLDLAMAELISLRLADYPKEVEAFLGLNKDGRAPVGTMGARIQLALLLEILTEEDAGVLRALKEVRNAFAHRVNVSFLSAEVQGHVQNLYRLLFERSERLRSKGLLKGSTSQLRMIKPHLSQSAEACAGLVLAVLAVYQAYFHRIHGRVLRVGKSYAGGREVAL